MLGFLPHLSSLNIFVFGENLILSLERLQKKVNEF
jgi:hypothetical protein